VTPEEMRAAFDEHREAEARRDLPAVIATFSQDCFLENVALGLRSDGPHAVLRAYQGLFAAFPDLGPEDDGIAFGDDVLVSWGWVSGTMEGPWLGMEPTGRSFRAAFTNVVPFSGGRMQGEKLLFDLADMCAQLGLDVEDLRARAAELRGTTAG
jgi:predicted ester cyclase